MIREKQNILTSQPCLHTLMQTHHYDGWNARNSHTVTDFGISADVSIFGIGLGWLGPVIFTN